MPVQVCSNPPASFPQPIPLEGARRYLPFSLYQELSARPGPEVVQRCAEHLAALLQTVRTYCPAAVLAEARPSHAAHGGWCEATLLFADIAGFTALSERLGARGRAGAEEITRIVNTYFAAMLDVLYQNGGELVKFGGDALLGMFTGPAQAAARCAVQAALDMQRAMLRFSDVDTSAGRFELHARIGIHTGRVFAAHVGGASQMEYWLVGKAVNHTALAEQAAAQGQVVVSDSTRQHLAGWLDHADFLLPAFYSVLSTQAHLERLPLVREGSVPADLLRLTQQLDTLTPYLPKGLLPRLVHSPQHQRVEGEHRLTAVLFANVDGLGELADSLADQPDVLAEMLQDYFATMQAIVEQHGGTLHKTDLYTTGDKVLAVFGAPVAHEDDVEQAAHAALAMQAALEDLNQRWLAGRPALQVHLQQRIGLSTGYVFSGNVGSETRQEYTIMGDEVNLAARLMSAAGWGDILTTSHVFAWLEGFGQFEAAGSLSVKGKQSPVPAYRLARLGQARRPRLPFVDREEACATLGGCLDRLLQGQGHVVILSGEPGIGKSRLWDELRARPQAGAALWLVGHCREQPAAYALLADVLRDWLGLDAADDPDTQRQVLAQKVTELFGPEQVESRCPGLAILMGLPLPGEWKEHVDFLGEHLPARLAKDVADWLDRLAEAQAVVWVCEDVHWIDAGSADVLLGVLELVEYAPLLLGFTLRPGQHPACEKITGTASTRFQAWYTPIALKALGAEYSVQLVTAILGQAAPAVLKDLLLERSRGNPLFIGEMARAAITSPTGAIPDRVQKVIEGRIDALAEGPRRAIKAAAVIGLQFSLPELVHALDEPEREVRRHLADLWRMQLVESKGKLYAFNHSFVWEVVYTGQAHHTRQALHHRLGAYWAGQANVYRAAEHYLAAEAWQPALVYAEQAADQKREAYAHQEAARLYRVALRAAEELGELAAQARLHGRLGQVYYQAGSYKQAAQAYERELELLQSQPGKTLARAEAHCALGQVYSRWGQYGQALEELERGLELAGPDSRVVRAQLRLVRCSVLINTGQLDEAERDGLAALQLAESAGARLDEAYACNNLGAVYGTQGRYEQALEYHQRSLALRRELAAQYEVAQSLNNVGTTLSYLGRWEEAEACYQEALDIQKHIGARRDEGITCHNLAWLHLDRGQPEEAEVEFLRALAIGEQIDDRQAIAFVHNDLGQLYLGQGRLQEARVYLEQAARHYEALGANTYLPENYAALARVYLELNLPPDALAAAQKALASALQNKDRRQEALAYHALGQAHLAGANLVQARLCAQMSLALAQADPPLPGQVAAAAELLDKMVDSQLDM